MPTYNSLKECKGREFFLLLPLNKMIDQVKRSSSGETALPDPELYIIVNGKPTSSNIIWRTLINVEDIRKAIQKLHGFTVKWMMIPLTTFDIYSITNCGDIMSRK